MKINVPHYRSKQNFSVHVKNWSEKVLGKVGKVILNTDLSDLFLDFVKMAKSLRSKWKRKMKAVKRVRYGEKEAKMLNKIVEGAKERRKEIEDEKAQTIEHNPQPLGGM